MFKKILRILALILFWGAAGYYVVWSLQESGRAAEQIVVDRMEICVTDSTSMHIITKEMVRQWIIDAGLNPEGRPVESVNTAAINDIITANPFVASVKSYVDFNGLASITVSQREPIFRVCTTDGYSFYYTRDGHIVPTTPYSSHYVPVVSGQFELPFAEGFTGELSSFIEEEKKNSDKSYLFLCKLINFVRYVSDDDFWDSEIVQINVMSNGNGAGADGKEPEVELIPRIGNNVVLMGTLDNFKDKLDRLKAFYLYARNWNGWDEGGVLNLKYDNQIVCTK